MNYKITDEQLIDRLKDGNTSAIDELYRRYAKKLFIFFKNIIHAPNPEDLVHDVFMRAIEKAYRFNPKKASFKTWLFRIARNHCIDLVRHQKKIKFLSLDQKTAHDDPEPELNMQDTLMDESQDVEESLIERSVFQAVHDCIDALKNEEEKQAIVLYYLVGKVYREIGEIVGKSISMVKKHLTAAREKMKRCLERKGINSLD